MANTHILGMRVCWSGQPNQYPTHAAKSYKHPNPPQFIHLMLFDSMTSQPPVCVPCTRPPKKQQAWGYTSRHAGHPHTHPPQPAWHSGTHNNIHVAAHTRGHSALHSQKHTVRPIHTRPTKRAAPPAPAPWGSRNTHAAHATCNIHATQAGHTLVRTTRAHSGTHTLSPTC